MGRHLLIAVFHHVGEVACEGLPCLGLPPILYHGLLQQDVRPN
jgi:hypothetical protein